MQHPELYWLYATSVSFTGQGAIAPWPVRLRDGDGGALGVFDESIVYFDRSSFGDSQTCLAKVEYKALTYEVRTDREVLSGLPGSTLELNRYVTREKTYNARALPIPRGHLKYIEAPWVGEPVPETGLQLIMPTASMKYVWHDVPDEPRVAILACVGKVNDAVFDGAKGWPEYAAETLLCLPPETKRYRTPVGRIAWRVTYNFLYQPETWNRFPTASGAFATVRWFSSRGLTSGSLTGSVSGSLSGLLDGSSISGTFSGTVNGTFTGTDDGQGTLTGTFEGSISGTLTDGSGSRSVSGNFVGSMTVRRSRDGERVYKTTNFNLLFTPPDPIRYQ